MLPTPRTTLRTVVITLFAIVLASWVTSPPVAQERDGEAGTRVHVRTASGEGLRVWLADRWDADRVEAAAARVDVPARTRAETPQAIPEISYLSRLTVDRLDAPTRERLETLARAGVPTICECGEQELAALLGLRALDATPPGEHELFAVRITPEHVERASFLMATDRKVETIVVGEQGTGLVPLAPFERDEPIDVEQIHTTLLGAAMTWAMSFELADVEEDEGVSVADTMDDVNPGSWTSLPQLSREWHLQFPNCCPWDWDTVANELTVRANFYKIPDGHADTDYYLAYVITQHNANKEVDYVASAGYCSDGWVGWYADERLLEIETWSPGLTNLLDYSPTGTVGSETVSISVGASLDVGKDPSAGINASFSTSYTQHDVTVYDNSSLVDDYADWTEGFLGPRYMSGPCPFCVWHFRHPALVGRTSFLSKRAALYETDQVAEGVPFVLDWEARFAKDHVDWDFCVLADVFSVARHVSWGFSLRWVDVFWNYPPSPPGQPSVPSPLWAGESTTISVAPADDRDGDLLSYRFDFGDGVIGPWADRSQSHTWVEPEEIRVRAKALDSHGADSPWSESTEVVVMGLDYVEVEGPAAVDEKWSAQIDARAYFSDGSARLVTSDHPSGWEGGSIVWSVDSPYATISDIGLLNTLDGQGQNRLITVTAIYTVHGRSSTDTHLITLVDTDLDGDCLPNAWDACPLDADCDDDGLPDGSCSPGEDLNNNGVLDPGETDPYNSDTDGDGLLDGMEAGLTAPLRPEHTNLLVFVPDADPSDRTDPTLYDTDCDGIGDGEEDLNRNGRVDSGEADPANADSDGDGIIDGEDTTPLFSAPSCGAMGCEYRLDDGTGEMSMGHYTGDFTWGNYFEARDGCEALCTIRAAFGPVTRGEVRLFVYDDPTDDRDPSDARLVAGPFVVNTAHEGFMVAYNDYMLPGPVVVRGGYYVVASMSHAPGEEPAGCDMDSSHGSSFYTVHSVAPEDPFMTGDFMPRPLEADGISGNWMLRTLSAPFSGTAFVTSTRSNGNLGGVTGADATCDALASAAGLPGAYKAWLSDSGGGPAMTFYQSAAPYQRVDGTVIANDFADLTDGMLAAPLNVTEAGLQLAGRANVWTGTGADGTPRSGGARCSDWSTGNSLERGAQGRVDRTDGGWSFTGASPCNRARRLYCFEQPVMLGGIVSKLIFVTSATTDGNLGGKAGANATCNALATAASLPGTFKAWLSDSAGGPNTDFFPNPIGYLRPDGAVVAVNYADLTDGNLLAPINITETGAMLPGPSGSTVWTGTSAMGNALDGAKCSDWGSNDSALRGAQGRTDSTTATWSFSGASRCDEQRRLYCVEQ